MKDLLERNYFDQYLFIPQEGYKQVFIEDGKTFVTILFYYEELLRKNRLAMESLKMDNLEVEIDYGKYYSIILNEKDIAAEAAKFSKEEKQTIFEHFFIERLEDEYEEKRPPDLKKLLKGVKVKKKREEIIKKFIRSEAEHITSQVKRKDEFSLFERIHKHGICKPLYYFFYDIPQELFFLINLVIAKGKGFMIRNDHLYLEKEFWDNKKNKKILEASNELMDFFESGFSEEALPSFFRNYPKTKESITIGNEKFVTFHYAWEKLLGPGVSFKAHYKRLAESIKKILEDCNCKYDEENKKYRIKKFFKIKLISDIPVVYINKTFFAKNLMNYMRFIMMYPPHDYPEDVTKDNEKYIRVDRAFEKLFNLDSHTKAEEHEIFVEEILDFGRFIYADPTNNNNIKAIYVPEKYIARRKENVDVSDRDTFVPDYDRTIFGYLEKQNSRPKTRKMSAASFSILSK